MTDATRARAMWRRGAGWLRRRLSRHALILMYHRVARLPVDPQLLAVTPEHFAEHLEILARECRVLRLGELVERLRRGRVPRRGVVVTFDDGYADNLHNARPLLERHGVPATVFVTSGHVGSDREFWWDELERLLLTPGTLPPALTLTTPDGVWRADVAAPTYTTDEWEAHRAWHIEQNGNPSGRHELYRRVYGLLHDRLPAEREAILDQLRQWARAGTAGRATHRALTAEELRALAAGDLVEVGAHSVTHPLLPALEPEQQWHEVRTSRTSLETLLGRPVRALAYPHGRRTAETVRLVREAGFASAACSDVDLVRRDSDWYQLPRVGVRDWDGARFRRWLERHLRG